MSGVSLHLLHTLAGRAVSLAFTQFHRELYFQQSHTDLPRRQFCGRTCWGLFVVRLWPLVLSYVSGIKWAVTLSSEITGGSVMYACAGGLTVNSTQCGIIWEES